MFPRARTKHLYYGCLAVEPPRADQYVFFSSLFPGALEVLTFVLGLEVEIDREGVAGDVTGDGRRRRVADNPGGL